MIALLSALLGFVTSTAPKIFDAFQDRRDKAQELELLKVQLQLNQQQADNNLNQTLAQADAASAAAVQTSYQAEIAAAEKVGDSFIIGLSASVRPVVTYAFFLLYAAIKIAEYRLMIHPALPWQQTSDYASALVAIWHDEDMNLFSYVVGFWFGERSRLK